MSPFVKKPDDTVNEKDGISEQTVITQIKGLNKGNERQAYIIFLSGPLLGKMFLLERGTIVFGRIREVDIPINDLGISRRHCSIEYKNGKATLRDMGSTNGTYLNGLKVPKAELKDGDKIQISSSTIMKFAEQDQDENIFQKELYKMAIVDALTGTYNKRHFEQRMDEEFSYCFRNKVPLSLAMFDIDHFKNINDTYGHPTGDHVLARICALAKTVVRNEDVLARYGGEEFVVILKATDAGGAFTLAERLRKLIEESPFEFEDKIFHVTISIGIATLTGQNFANWEAMLKQADVLLYKSKESGRNRVSAA